MQKAVNIRQEELLVIRNIVKGQHVENDKLGRISDIDRRNAALKSYHEALLCRTYSRAVSERSIVYLTITIL